MPDDEAIWAERKQQGLCVRCAKPMNGRTSCDCLDLYLFPFLITLPIEPTTPQEDIA